MQAMTPTTFDPAAEGTPVKVEDLVKRYPKRPVNAVDGVSFEVRRGEVFGLLGPNGAGKTTTVGVLTTRVKPTGGRGIIAGVDVTRDPVGARRRIGVVPQRSNLDRSLSARQNLLFHAAYHGIAAEERRRRAQSLIELFGLADRADDKVDFFSGGQAQRIMIARALMHEPDVLFLDEPTTGLDPQARLFVWDRVRELRKRGVTMILTTHDMDEATQLCERVGIMDHGKILAMDTPDALTATVPGKNTLEVGIKTDQAGRDRLVAALGSIAGVEKVERVTKDQGGPPAGSGPLRLRLYVNVEAPLIVAPVARVVTDAQAELQELAIGKPSLEDVFIHLTGRALR